MTRISFESNAYKINNLDYLKCNNQLNNLFF